MKWRLREGNGEAIYNIGVEDNGVMTGIIHTLLRSKQPTENAGNFSIITFFNEILFVVVNLEYFNFETK